MTPNVIPSASLVICHDQSIRTAVESTKGTSRRSSARRVNPTDHSSASWVSTSGTVARSSAPTGRTSNSCSVGHHLAPERLGL